MFEDAIRNKSHIVLDPYDFNLILKLLDVTDAVKLYNLLATLEEEHIEEGVGEPFEIIVLYNGRLFKRILRILSKYAGVKKT